MIFDKGCPVCGGQIAFSYVRPTYDFYIADGKIKRDTNKDLWDGVDPYLDYYCTNDKTHDLEGDPTDDSFSKWKEEVEREFYNTMFPHL